MVDEMTLTISDCLMDIFDKYDITDGNSNPRSFLIGGKEMFWRYKYFNDNRYRNKIEINCGGNESIIISDMRDMKKTIEKRIDNSISIFINYQKTYLLNTIEIYIPYLSRENRIEMRKKYGPRILDQ